MEELVGRRRHLLALGLLAGVALTLAGCGGGPKHTFSTPAPVVVQPPPASPPRRATPPRCASGAVALGSTSLTFAARVLVPTAARSAAGAGRVLARLRPLDVNGLPAVVGVLAAREARLGERCSDRYFRVELPVVPNSTSGWVPASALAVYPVRSRIVVSLRTRRLELFRAGRLVLRATVGIGAAATPTPVGRFFVDERYVLTETGGPFGPEAIGISAHSVVLAHRWVEGGPIALHGTDEPWSIGEAASNGCIHLPNSVIRRLFPLAPDGTPVVIEA